MRVLVVPGLVLAVLLVPGAMTAQDATLPKGVTQQMITDGAKVFSGAGICMACHGPEGKGIPNLGANLTDKEWAQGDGSYESILKTIMTGVPADKSASGAVMPPKGGSGISDEQAKAVAAYVWSLSRKSG